MDTSKPLSSAKGLEGISEEGNGKDLFQHKTAPARGAVVADGEASFLLQEKESHVVNLGAVGEEYGTFDPSFRRLNSGLVLWFQQVYAIFVKHLLHGIRFWPSLIWQLVVPIAFVIFCLAYVITVPKAENSNPGRLLSLRNTAPSKSIDFFQANLGGLSSPLTFKSGDTKSIGISTVFNFTDDIERIRQNVSNYSSVENCCNYRYQILDKFCATRSVSEISLECKSNDSFSFKTCIDCLGCNKSLLSTSYSCTSPLPYYDYNNCPISPPISYTDFENINRGVPVSGPVDDYNTYVAEKLLQVSGSYLNPTSFFRKYQGGFVVHPTSAIYSTCACNDTSESEVCETLSPALDYNYPPEDPAQKLSQSSIDCPVLFNTSNAVCSTNDSWNYEYNWMVNYCIEEAVGNFIQRCPDRNEHNQYIITENPPTTSQQQPTVTIWYNNQPYHMAPAVLNSFYSLYLQQTTGNTISVTNQPLPRAANEEVDDSVDETVGYFVSLIGVFGTCFLFSSFVISLIQERETKAKHIQFVSGVGTTSYWVGTFLFDILNALVPTVAIVIVFAIFNVDGFRRENLAAIFLLFLLSTWAAIPISYMFSFLFKNSLIAFAILIMGHYFVFLIFQITVLLVSPHDRKILYYIFLLHPTYGLGSGLTDLYNNQVTKDTCTKNERFEEICKRSGYTYLDNIFQWERPGINYTFIYLFLEGIVFFIFTLLLERQLLIPEIRRLISFIFHSRQNAVTSEIVDPYEDSDVVAERNRVRSMDQPGDNDVVVIKDLRKVYKGVVSCFFPCVRSGYKNAVNGIDLVIPAGECFGLLGVNGAGKTTTFNILTGDMSATGGSATIAGYDISTQLHQVQKKIGYCPQFDAIIDLLTGRELLTLFARLRGIPEKHIKKAVQFEIDRLDLVPHANKRSGNYSGGNKRKLSTAIALIGSPPIIFLDEPTTGMDPVTRRFLWDALINIVREGRSVVLTSHSMEECEALCSRLAIMVNGKFKCLGSTQHLKSKYGAGYTMQLQVSQELPPQPVDGAQPQVVMTSPPNINELHQFVTAEFPGSVLLESHQSSLTYHIPAGGVTWSSMFGKVENNKSRFGIVNYSVSQTTLDQVFINFAKQQAEDGMATVA